MNNLPPQSSLSRRRYRSKTEGFTLVEVMVALIIIAIGMFGIAKMQALALSSTGASRSRALAAIEASSLASAIHANRAFWSSSATVPGTITIATAPGTTTPTFTSTEGAMQAALTAAAASTCPTSMTMKATLSCLCTAACNANTYINMAANDVVDWGDTLNSLLPTATATVTCNNSLNPVDCIITIQWVENAVALSSQQASAVAANSNASAATTAAAQWVTYNLYVVP